MYNRSAIKTYDLAVGGGTIDRHMVNPVFPTAKTFYDQIEHYFRPFYGPASSSTWQSESTLFAVFFGVMDLIIPFHDEERPPIDKLIKSYESELEKVICLVCSVGVLMIAC